jgi:hypothetical protein
MNKEHKFKHTKKKNRIKNSPIYMYGYVATSDWKLLTLKLVWQYSKDLTRNDYLFQESLSSSVNTPGQLQIYHISDY